MNKEIELCKEICGLLGVISVTTDSLQKLLLESELNRAYEALGKLRFENLQKALG